MLGSDNVIGRKIYYEIPTGNVILSIGEPNGNVVPTTIDQDIEFYKALSERNRETFDVIELEHGQYAQDFEESNGFRVNPETKKIEFSYPDPNAPEEPQPYQAPLSEVVAHQTDYLLDVDFRLMMIELGMN